MEQLKNEIEIKKMEVSAFKTHCDEVYALYPNLNFTYSDPDPGFDRRLVYGAAAILFDVRDEMFCQAIEAAAGEKLYNIVIQNDVIGKNLIKKGNLQRPTTFLPLNKMTASDLPDNIIERAKQVGGSDNVWFAKDLISYPDYLEPAMKFLFGQVLVCRDLDIAEKVAYDEGVMTHCVTLDGDEVHPDGNMSGGAENPCGSVLEYLYANKARSGGEKTNLSS